MDINKTLIDLLKQFKELNEKYQEQKAFIESLNLNDNSDYLSHINELEGEIESIKNQLNHMADLPKDIPNYSDVPISERETYIPPEIIEYGDILYMPNSNVSSNLPPTTPKITLRFKDKIYNNFILAVNTNNVAVSHKHLIFDLNTDGLEDANDAHIFGNTFLSGIRDGLETISFTKNHNYVFSPTDASIQFYLPYIKELNFYWFDFTNAPHIYFQNCTSLERIDNLYLPNMNTLASLFSNCKKLEYVDLKKINLVSSKLNSNSGYLQSTFNYCENLKELDLRHIVINDSNISSTYWSANGFAMECKKLEYVDVSNIDFSHCYDFDYMFSGCSNLKKIIGILDFSKVSTKIKHGNVTCSNTYSMFTNCTSLSDVVIKNPPSDFFNYSGLKKEQCTIINE